MPQPRRFIERVLGIRYAADAACVGLVCAIAAVQLWVITTRPSMNATFILAGALLLPELALAAVVHNHSHVPTFRSTAVNRLFELVLFLQTGMFASKFRLHHELGHHIHYTDSQRDPSRWVYRDGREMGRLVYIMHYFFTYNYHVYKIGRSYPRLLATSIWHTALCWLAFAGLVVLAPMQSLIMFGVPIVLIWLGFISLTYDDHISLHSTDPYSASHTKTNGLLNWMFFNNGYHLAHHVKAGVHWSELPRYHAKIAEGIQVKDPVTTMNRIMA
jgi:fatty acid desaturase